MTKEEERSMFFYTLYEKVKDDIMKVIESVKIGEELDLDKRASSNIVKYLEGEGLIKITGSMGYNHKIKITHEGVRSGERDEF